MADSRALILATSALTAYLNMGAPEGLIPLTHAIIYVCMAPKSNSVVMARDRAHHAVSESKDDNVPHYLRDRSYTHPIDDGSQYRYVHDYGGWVDQQYLPDSIRNVTIYEPSTFGEEKSALEKMRRIREKKDVNQ